MKIQKNYKLFREQKLLKRSKINLKNIKVNINKIGNYGNI